MTAAVFFPGLVPMDPGDLEGLLRRSAPARRRFGLASDVLGYPLADALFDAADTDWEIIDCGCLTTALALADSAADTLVPAPELSAGMSFGGLPAVVRAGGLEFADALLLVTRSARIQARYLAEQPEPGACMFFLGPNPEQVRGLVGRLAAAGHWIEISAQLGPDIHAVSGGAGTLALFQEGLRDLGGRAFHTMNRPQHCAALTPLRDELERDVYRTTPFRRSRLPVLSDIDGALLRDPADLRTFLLAGWVEPVYLSATVDGLRAAAADRVYLAGPRSLFGRLLGGVCEVVAIGFDGVAEPVAPVRPPVREGVRETVREAGSGAVAVAVRS